MAETEQSIAEATLPEAGAEAPAAPEPAPVEAAVPAAPEPTPEPAVEAATPVEAVPVAEQIKRGRGRPRKAAPAAAELKAKPAPKAAPKPAAPRKAPVVKAKPAAAIAKTKSKPAPVKVPKLAVKPAPVAKAPAPQKETVKMATKTKTTDFTAKFQESFKDQAEKAKAAFGDAGEFAKGNVEAVVASAKILGAGVKTMGETYVAETKSAYETMTADIKELAAVKSPTEFFELQTKLFRKNFDAAMATGSKKSEEVLKLANEAFQPISTRFSLAIEKIKKVA